VLQIAVDLESVRKSHGRAEARGGVGEKSEGEEERNSGAGDVICSPP
jgi:hypothetical protein